MAESKALGGLHATFLLLLQRWQVGNRVPQCPGFSGIPQGASWRAELSPHSLPVLAGGEVLAVVAPQVHSVCLFVRMKTPSSLLGARLVRCCNETAAQDYQGGVGAQSCSQAWARGKGNRVSPECQPLVH